MQDKEILCSACGELFTFDVEEQARFRALGYDSPKRCPDCRRNRSRSLSKVEDDGRWRNGGKPVKARQKQRRRDREVW